MHWERKTAAVLLALGLSAACPAPLAARPPDPGDNEDRQIARRGVNLMMNGDLDGATAVFHQIQSQDPQSPVGYLLEAEALWWRIYFSTANLLDSDVFDVASLAATPEDNHFNDLVAVAIQRSEANLHAHDDEARSLLYEGMAYALRARLEGLRGRDLPTGRAGKKMRSLLMRSVELDPKLADAYLGLGVYNYLAGTLPIAEKVLQAVVALPQGNRESGLEQLRRASTEGELCAGEAKFYLGKNLSRTSENSPGQALALFEELTREYPNNPLWPLIAASLKFRMGLKSESETLYRSVFSRTAAERNDTERGVHRAARAALLSQHPNEKFGE